MCICKAKDIFNIFIQPSFKCLNVVVFAKTMTTTLNDNDGNIQRRKTTFRLVQLWHPSLQTKKKRWTRQNHVNTIECRNYKRQNAKIENVSECKSHINTIECKNNKLQKQHKCIRFVKSKIQLKMTKMPKRRISKH